jgi:hypothetical protein
MIVGRKVEPYLGDALDSLADVCDHAVINDNSGLEERPNEAAILASPFAESGRLTHLRTRFVDFAGARNACIDATPVTFAGQWALFADADEVHGDELGAMAAVLPRLPPDVDTLDGYSRNFIGSFSYWNTLHRRLRFFRLTAQRRWEGSVHERLTDLRRREAVPAIGAHYGHVCTPESEVERERLYKTLGQPRTLLDRVSVEHVSPSLVWGDWLRDALPFTGRHPSAVLKTVALLSPLWADTFTEVDRIVAAQSPVDRVRNQFRKADYSRLLLFRAAQARLRWGYHETKS